MFSRAAPVSECLDLLERVVAPGLPWWGSSPPDTRYVGRPKGSPD